MLPNPVDIYIFSEIPFVDEVLFYVRLHFSS
jgi:hypothetical protein